MLLQQMREAVFPGMKKVYFDISKWGTEVMLGDYEAE